MLSGCAGSKGLLRGYQSLKQFAQLEGLAQSPMRRRPFCTAIIAEAPSFRSDLSYWACAGLDGVCTDLSDQQFRGGVQCLRVLNRFAETTRKIAPALIADAVTNRAALIAAWSAGFTHVSGDVIAHEDCADLTPVRLAPEDLYAPLSKEGADLRRAAIDR